MIAGFLAASFLAASDASAASACAPGERCVQVSAAQMFALAEVRYAQGDAVAAAEILRALTRDKHPELRAEARFRLAALCEKVGDLPRAAEALRELLAEQPNANPARLELARILAKLGRKRDAERELAKAEAGGLPPAVEQNVRRFSVGLHSQQKRGFTVDLAGGPDSNINRATGSRYVDTIIAPFELDPDARAQAGLGFSIGVEGYSRDTLLGGNWLSRAGSRADLFGKARFNDVQFTLDTGPQVQSPIGRVRPSAVYERRWYGGHLYSSGYGTSLNLLAEIGTRGVLEIEGTRVHQRVAPNRGLDGWRTTLAASLSHPFIAGTTAMFSLRGANLDAKLRPESLRQRSADLLLARQFSAFTLFAEAGYTRTNGVEPLFLFGKTRHERRLDLIGGAVLTHAEYAGFRPLVRLTYSESHANIALYNYHRSRLDFGLSRTF